VRSDFITALANARREYLALTGEIAETKARIRALERLLLDIYRSSTDREPPLLGTPHHGAYRTALIYGKKKGLPQVIAHDFAMQFITKERKDHETEYYRFFNQFLGKPDKDFLRRIRSATTRRL